MDGIADEIPELAPTIARLIALTRNPSLTEDDCGALLLAVKVIGFVSQRHVMPELNSYLLNFPVVMAAHEQRLRELGIDIDENGTEE